MSRKQYRDIAEVIRAEVGETPLSGHDLSTFDDAVATYNIASGLATVFEIDSPRFDRDRFMAACNIDEVSIRARIQRDAEILRANQLKQ
jgi:hypothetical protein